MQKSENNNFNTKLSKKKKLSSTGFEPTNFGTNSDIEKLTFLMRIAL